MLHSSVNAAEVSLRQPRKPDLWWTHAIEIPVVMMFILYHPIVETLLRGINPGKRFVGLRIATLAGGVPNPGPLLLRNLFRLIDSAPIFYGVGLLMTMFNRNGQRLGDLAAGTLLVYDNGRSEMKVEAGDGFDAAAVLIAEHRGAARRLTLARCDNPQQLSRATPRRQRGERSKIEIRRGGYHRITRTSAACPARSEHGADFLDNHGEDQQSGGAERESRHRAPEAEWPLEPGFGTALIAAARIEFTDHRTPPPGEAGAGRQFPARRRIEVGQNLSEPGRRQQPHRYRRTRSGLHDTRQFFELPQGGR